MHLLGFIIRIYHDALSPKRQIRSFIRLERDKNSPYPFNMMTYDTRLKDAAENSNLHRIQTAMN